MKATAFALVAFVAVSSCTSAQSIPAGNVYVGYSFVSTNPGLDVGNLAPTSLTTSGRTKLNGWCGSVAVKLFHWVDGVFDVGGNYGTAPATFTVLNLSSESLKLDANLHTYLGGPRVSVSLGRVRPFAEGLFGWAHQTLTSRDGFAGTLTEGSFAWALGGGVDYRLVKALGWRVEADYLQMRKFLLDQQQRDVRVSTGLVLNF